jgi:hypothetical protein
VGLFGFLKRAKPLKRCFVGYFGVNRALGITYPGLHDNILTPLAEHGFEITQAAHFNCPEHFHSPRSGEHRVEVADHRPSQLDLELCWLEPQHIDKLGGLYKRTMKFPWWNEADRDGMIRRNALLQLHSLSRLGRLLEMLDSSRFDLFCILRADLLYLDPMPVADIVGRIEGGADLVTPSWHRWNGLNDRFAFCSPKGVQAYLNRIDAVDDFCTAKGFFHTETLLGHLVETTGLKNEFTGLRARRVRANGVIRDEDFSL